MVMPYHLHMPSYFLETFTEYPYYYSIGNVSCLLITLTEVVIPIPIKTF